MRVKLWGLRGSLPSPLEPADIEDRIRRAAVECVNKGLKTESDVAGYLSTLSLANRGGYGGNTTCVEVSTVKQTILIDAGSGIRAFGNMRRSASETHVIFTHFHWDHLIGLMFYMPIFTKGHTIHFYSVQEDLEENIRVLFTKPRFPVAYEHLGAKLVFHRLEPRQRFRIGDIDIAPYRLDHPDPCWGYRVAADGRVYSHCVDTECTRTSAADLGADMPLYQGVDAMVFDAQYTLEQAATRASWGHAAASIGLDIAMRENIKKVYFVHYDPSASDSEIAAAERVTRDYYISHVKTERRSGRTVHEVDWRFAQEGDLIVLE